MQVLVILRSARVGYPRRARVGSRRARVSSRRVRVGYTSPVTHSLTYNITISKKI